MGAADLLGARPPTLIEAISEWPCSKPARAFARDEGESGDAQFPRCSSGETQEPASLVGTSAYRAKQHSSGWGPQRSLNAQEGRGRVRPRSAPSHVKRWSRMSDSA